jgi:hypothetical protein
MAVESPNRTHQLRRYRAMVDGYARRETPRHEWQGLHDELLRTLLREQRSGAQQPLVILEEMGELYELLAHIERRIEDAAARPRG